VEGGPAAASWSDKLERQYKHMKGGAKKPGESTRYRLVETGIRWQLDSCGDRVILHLTDRTLSLPETCKAVVVPTQPAHRSSKSS